MMKTSSGLKRKAQPLPDTPEQGYVEHNGARIWFAAYGSPTTCVPSPRRTRPQRQLGVSGSLPHGNGYRAIVIDSRGHGRSTRDEQPYTYELMASDVVAVMDTLGLEQARLVDRDGACTGLILAANSSCTCCRRVLLRLQYGSERHQGIHDDSHHSAPA